MNLDDAMNRRFTSTRPDGALDGQPLSAETLQSLMSHLVEVFGSTKAAAAAAGIGYSTWTHIRAGRRPPASFTLRRMRATSRTARAGSRGGRFRRWPGVVIYGRVTLSNDDRTRALRIGQWPDDSGQRALDAVQADAFDAWTDGDARQAARLLGRPVEAQFGLAPGQFNLHVDVHDIRWFGTQSAANHWANGLRVIHHRV